ncbi:MAG TPA: pseudouridine-5'-phosphate glycosidase [Blastocatellia bacterium]|nr:pseudouridine-5'-phosphate glycosidase [Blastocatellia bacterium]
MTRDLIHIPPAVVAAINNHEALVALESSVLAQGLPAPLNLETARACEEAVRREGATPVTIGIVDGVPLIGLSDREMEIFAGGSAPDGSSIEKVSLNNLAGQALRGSWGATTVAASMQIACGGGVRVFSTGGIGGVHRGVADSFDISTDLTVLGRIPLICVCAGAKAILDLPKTVEQLETLGIPVIGYRTEEFPAFYSRSSGLPVDITVQSPDEAAELAWRHWRSGITTAVLVCVPVPEEFELPAAEIGRATEQAVEEAARTGVRGKRLTPFLLAQMEKRTGGRTLQTNRSLLINNASVAAQIALRLNKM